MRTGIFVQVRLGSTRLPGKALLPLAGSTVVGCVMRALAPVSADVRALLTDHASAASLRPAADAEGWELFAGAAEDVLGRFAAAARTFGVGRVVRVTGDNPLTCPVLARDIIALHDSRGADLSHFLGCPLGTGVEVIEAAALFAAEREAADPREREHITTWHYGHRDRLVILEPQAPRECLLPGVHVSIDSAPDYERVKQIFADCAAGLPVTAAALVAHLSGAVRA